MMAEVAGDTIASANSGRAGKILKRIVCDHLEGGGGRTKIESWMPRWMQFPPAAYTEGAETGASRPRLRSRRPPLRWPPGAGH